MRQAYLEAFETYVEQIMESYGAVGLIVSAIDPQKCLYRRSFGWADLEEKRLIDEHTIFGLASITKSFTCLAIMQLYEKKIIDINAPVSQYIPEFTNKNHEPVLVWHLMSHSAGFYPRKRLCAVPLAKEMGLSQEKELAYNTALAEEAVRRVAAGLDEQTDHIAYPGEFLSYSNDSFGLLAEMIRRYGGEASYADYINKYILEPLGMERSCCDFLKPAVDPNAATLYYFEDGKRCSSRDYYRSAFALMGGGALKSTISDMESYLRMYLLNGWGDMDQIIEPASIAQMIVPRVNYRYEEKYGYGLAIGKMEDAHLIGHGGSLPGVSSYFMWSPEMQKGVVVLCNTTGAPAATIARALMRVLKDLPPLEEREYREMPWRPEVIRLACGRYSCEEGHCVELVPCGNGIGVKDGEEVYPAKMVAPDALIYRRKLVDADVKVFYRRDGTFWGMRSGGRVLKKEN